MIIQLEVTLKPRKRGFHLVTEEIADKIGPLPERGIVNLLLKHTSAALSVNENADPSVRRDMEKIFDSLVREGEPYYEHTQEGRDDMPAHAKSMMAGASLTLPITDGKFNLGTWQGIYLCEFRNSGGARTLTATVIGQ